MKHYRLLAGFVVLTAAPAWADDERPAGTFGGTLGIDRPTSALSSKGMSAEREAALRSTIEKRKQRRVRDRMAYNRSVAQVNAMTASWQRRGSTGLRGPSLYAQRSEAGDFSAFSVTVPDGAAEPAFGQVGAAGSPYSAVGTGGGGRCNRQ